MIHKMRKNIDKISILYLKAERKNGAKTIIKSLLIQVQQTVESG